MCDFHETDTSSYGCRKVISIFINSSSLWAMQLNVWRYWLKQGQFSKQKTRMGKLFQTHVLWNDWLSDLSFNGKFLHYWAKIIFVWHSWDGHLLIMLPESNFNIYQSIIVLSNASECVKILVEAAVSLKAEDETG